MDAALGWVGAVVEWFGQFLPRWKVIDTRHAWIKWVGGRMVWRRWRPGWDATMRVYTGGTGIVWHWPAVTQFYFHPTARQSFDLRAQTITTRDNAQVLVGGLITYQIDDIEKAVGLTWDTDEAIRDSALTAIHDVVSSMTWEELRNPETSRKLKGLLRDEARKVLEPYGVKVLKLSLTDFAKTIVLKVAMSNDTVL